MSRARGPFAPRSANSAQKLRHLRATLDTFSTKVRDRRHPPGFVRLARPVSQRIKVATDRLSRRCYGTRDAGHGVAELKLQTPIDNSPVTNKEKTVTITREIMM